MISNLSEDSICFIANYSKTYFFDAVAQELERFGVPVCWVVVNHDLYGYLLQRYPKERILHVNWCNKDVPAPKVGEFKLNELIYGDRCLRYYPDEAKRYLINIQTPIYNFLRKMNARWVVGEVTWAHEVLIHRIVSLCDDLNCAFMNPHTIRIPNGRFAFFTDEWQSQLWQGPGCVDSYPISAGTSQPEREGHVAKPDYLFLNDALVRRSRSTSVRLKRIKRFITKEKTDDNDPTLLSKRWKWFKVRACEELNKELYRFVKRLPLSAIGESPFVFIALHKQPEASVDVLGRYYEDQFQNIINIWRIIPDNWLVVVKEHTNAIGDRGPSFYRKLQKYPGIVFVHEATDSHELILRSQLVVTISGTVAYEAALMGKPSLSFAPAFFNRLPGCRKVTNDDLKQVKNIGGLIGDVSADETDFNQWLDTHSFPGIISDPISNPKCMEDENISSVSNAFMSLIGEQNLCKRSSSL